VLAEYLDDHLGDAHHAPPGPIKDAVRVIKTQAQHLGPDLDRNMWSG
jgi:hypothetical protein